MSTIQTRNNLDILLHFACSRTTHPRAGAPAVTDGIQWLVEEDMLQALEVPGQYKTTPKGQFYIEYLMTIPFPVQTFKIPEFPE